MTLFQKILTGFLLVLTGVMIGMLMMIYSAGVRNADNTQVRITEVSRSVGHIGEIGPEITNPGRPALGNVASSVTPAVVYIETIISISRSTNPHVSPDQNEDENLLDRLIPRRRGSSIGSGVLISTDGYILTNNHVISGADRSSITVGLSDKRTFQARIVGQDPSTDLAVLKIDATDLPAIVIGNSDQLVVGDWVVAVGNPFRLRSTVTAGIVSALGRNVDIINEQMRIESFIQTDAAINRGNSGGALVNQYGELIGINTAIATENGAYQGYGFAIPINMAFKIARDLIEFGEVQRAYLGVHIVAVGQDRARQLGMDFIRGVEIVNMVRAGSAYAAGLRISDVILSVNGIEVNEANELQAQIALHRPGEDVALNVLRSGQNLNIQAKLFGVENDQIRSWLGRD
mgnify:FL=1